MLKKPQILICHAYCLSTFFLGDVVVRVTFVLGNLAARSSEARIGIGMHCDTVSLLPLLLRHHFSFFLFLMSQIGYSLSTFFLGDVVVRVTFVLGNLAARSSEARIGIGMHCDTVSLLPLLLRHYLSDMLREVTNSSDVFTNLEFRIYKKI